MPCQHCNTPTLYLFRLFLFPTHAFSLQHAAKDSSGLIAAVVRVPVAQGVMAVYGFSWLAIHHTTIRRKCFASFSGLLRGDSKRTGMWWKRDGHDLRHAHAECFISPKLAASSPHEAQHRLDGTAITCDVLSYFPPPGSDCSS